MVKNESFLSWFAGICDTNEHEVAKILKEPFALHFLIAWSLFEAKCFNKEFKAAELKDFAQGIVRIGVHRDLAEIAAKFHARYQDQEKLKHLFREKADATITKLTQRSFEELQKAEVVHFLIYVIFRFRNNMFHGNKGAGSWLKYEEQIKDCTQALQIIVSHVRSTTQSQVVEASMSDDLES